MQPLQPHLHVLAGDVLQAGQALGRGEGEELPRGPDVVVDRLGALVLGAQVALEGPQ